MQMIRDRAEFGERKTPFGDVLLLGFLYRVWVYFENSTRTINSIRHFAYTMMHRLMLLLLLLLMMIFFSLSLSLSVHSVIQANLLCKRVCVSCWCIAFQSANDWQKWNQYSIQITLENGFRLYIQMWLLLRISSHIFWDYYVIYNP